MLRLVFSLQRLVFSLQRLVLSLQRLVFSLPLDVVDTRLVDTPVSFCTTQSASASSNICLSGAGFVSTDVGVGCTTSQFQIGLLLDSDWYVVLARDDRGRWGGLTNGQLHDGAADVFAGPRA